MSRMIKLTKECIEECKQEFLNALANMRLTDNKVVFSKAFGASSRRAKLLFTEKALLKINALVHHYDSEVAWHGTAHRTGEGEYTITDIFVYPQTVSGATVDTAQEEYQGWLMELDDNTFNSIRMQGHSHVNMGTSPSNIDISHQSKIVNMMGENDFYIFLICNKRGEMTVKIYDFGINTLFETADVDVEVVTPVVNLHEFLKKSEELVKERQYVAATSAIGGVSSAYYAGNTSSFGGKKKKKKNKNNKFYNNTGYSDLDDPYGPFGFTR